MIICNIHNYIYIYIYTHLWDVSAAICSWDDHGPLMDQHGWPRFVALMLNPLISGLFLSPGDPWRPLGAPGACFTTWEMAVKQPWNGRLIEIADAKLRHGKWQHCHWALIDSSQEPLSLHARFERFSWKGSFILLIFYAELSSLFVEKPVALLANQYIHVHALCFWRHACSMSHLGSKQPWEITDGSSRCSSLPFPQGGRCRCWVPSLRSSWWAALCSFGSMAQWPISGWDMDQWSTMEHPWSHGEIQRWNGWWNCCPKDVVKEGSQLFIVWFICFASRLLASEIIRQWHNDLMDPHGLSKHDKIFQGPTSIKQTKELRLGVVAMASIRTLVSGNILQPPKVVVKPLPWARGVMPGECWNAN